MNSIIGGSGSRAGKMSLMLALMEQHPDWLFIGNDGRWHGKRVVPGEVVRDSGELESGDKHEQRPGGKR